MPICLPETLCKYKFPTSWRQANAHTTQSICIFLLGFSFRVTLLSWDVFFLLLLLPGPQKYIKKIKIPTPPLLTPILSLFLPTLFGGKRPPHLPSITTSPPSTDQLFPRMKKDGDVWECSAGMGSKVVCVFTEHSPGEWENCQAPCFKL